MVPVMVSVTVNNRSGRTFTGQTLEEIYASIQHYSILSFGVNCSFGVANMRPIIERIASQIPKYISFTPMQDYPTPWVNTTTPRFHRKPHQGNGKRRPAQHRWRLLRHNTPIYPKIAQSIKSLPPHTPSNDSLENFWE